MSYAEAVSLVVLVALTVLAAIASLIAKRAATVEREKIFDDLRDMDEPDLKRFQEALKAYDRIKKYERGVTSLNGRSPK